MKVLASDYDGTLCIENKYQQSTSDAIRKWQKAGNLFGIVTGRDIRMIKDAIEREHIPFDFLICNNGCALYNSDYQELYSEKLPLRIIKKLINSSTVARSSYIVLADDRGRYIYDNDYKPDKYREVFYTDVLDAETLEEHPWFYQMDTRYQTAEEMHAVSRTLDEELGDEITTHPNVTTVDMTPKGVTKLTGLQRYIKISELEKVEIITAGDGYNDLPMLKHYKGYAMAAAVDFIKEHVYAVTSNVDKVIEREL